MRARPWLAWAWVAAIAVGTAVVLAVNEGSFFSALVEDEGLALLPIVFTVVGAMISTRQPGNRIAWLMYFLGAGLMMEGFAVWLAPTTPPLSATPSEVFALIWLATAFFAVLILPLTLMLHTFPTGRFLSSRWNWVGWVTGVVIVVLLIVEVFATEIGPGDESWTIENPIGFIEGSGLVTSGLPQVVFGVGLLTLMGTGIVSIVVRYRRSSAEVRAQIRWVVFALVLLMLGLLVQIFVAEFSGGVFLTITMALVPVSIAVAVTRYRLFDIDRVVSRTVGYAIVLVVLALVFASIVLLPGLLIGGLGEDGSAQEAPPVLVAASTLAVAALFNPVRRRVLGWVDRRFNRSRYDAEQVVEAMTYRLQEGVNADVIVDEALDVVVATMQPAAVGAWVRE